MSKPLTPILVPLVALFVLVGAGAAASPARATATAKPCWERVTDDWLDNGTIDGSYKPACYQAALRHLPEDLRDYTGIEDAIAAALQRSLRGQDAAGGGDKGDGSNGASRGSGGEKATHSTKSAGQQRTLQGTPQRSYYRRAIDRLGPTSAESFPIPLLVLAGLATVLLLTACGLAIRMRLRARRAGHSLSAQQLNDHSIRRADQ
jgi:hypothetical protein